MRAAARRTGALASHKAGAMGATRVMSGKAIKFGVEGKLSRKEKVQVLNLAIFEN